MKSEITAMAPSLHKINRLLPALALILAALVWSPSVSLAQEQSFWEEGSNSQPVVRGGRPDNFAELADDVSAAVINLDVQYKGNARPSWTKNRPKERIGQGSGFIITADGYALTNNHVVENAEEILVTLADDRKFRATIVGNDPSTDVALIKLKDAEGLPVLPLGDSDALSVGDWVLAIGSPLGLRSTVTAGIVSATGRKEINPGRRQIYSNFIQTDASINPGNSGGPLVNLAGDVVGINTAINRLGQGIGFAIPVNMIKTILPRLRGKGYVERSWIGIMIQDLDAKLARSFGLDKAEGALVTDVVPHGPAASAGLRSGDVILKFEDKTINSSDELPWLASTAGVGRKVSLLVWRDGRRRRVKLKLSAMPGQSKSRPSSSGQQANQPRGELGDDLGIKVRDIARELARTKLRGVLVVKIDELSPANASGLRQGDVVVQIDDVDVKNSRQFYGELKKRRQRDIIRFKIRRGGSTYFFAFEPDEM